MARNAVDIRVERAGADEKSFIDVFELLLALHREGGFARLSTDKASENAYRVLCEGMTFVARDKNGKAIGTLALTELSFWYAGETFLQDAWFYVRPRFRKKNVGIDLMRAARKEGEARGKIVFVTVNNPDRRPKKTPMSLESQIAGFAPLGYTMKLR